MALSELAPPWRSLQREVRSVPICKSLSLIFCLALSLLSDEKMGGK